MRPETETALRTALDAFSGADGGAAFFALRLLVEDMDALAAKGDPDAARLVEEVKRFARLIEIASRHYLPSGKQGHCAKCGCTAQWHPSDGRCRAQDEHGPCGCTGWKEE